MSPDNTASLQHTGVILFGHGSRDPLWREPMERMADALRRRRADRPVLCAYLELSKPDLEGAMQQLRGQHPQLRTVWIYPVFLGMGTHARQDLPRLRDELAAQHPDLTIALAPALGTDDRLIELVADIIEAQMGDA
ncbi:hypothetical protein AAV94_10060 [Lampropedia cohaerens]|uniref:Cobalamin biosynthesis protein CbiX n=1 Tax=Lampropedia cohaerens TaxID=1610491 RepID=A0A0U1PYA4_9BURK|nr:CbiX/SirB N-terminal domain-containing protein [Lampropedia cohaerens]KKW67500.1 hypothetical protein AAV94_10060 [Lampropedia cohaerens]